MVRGRKPQRVLSRKREVSRVVRGHGHHGAGAVAESHEAADPHRDLRACEWMDDVDAREDAFLRRVLGAAFEVGLRRRRVEKRSDGSGARAALGERARDRMLGGDRKECRVLKTELTESMVSNRIPSIQACLERLVDTIEAGVDRRVEMTAKVGRLLRGATNRVADPPRNGYACAFRGRTHAPMATAKADGSRELRGEELDLRPSARDARTIVPSLRLA